MGSYRIFFLKNPVLNIAQKTVFKQKVNCKRAILRSYKINAFWKESFHKEKQYNVRFFIVFIMTLLLAY
jgi:hypothetical protein